MTIALYDITVPVFTRGLGRLGALLEQGRAYAEAEGIAPEELLAARLAPDMLTLTGQVQRASDTAKLAAVRIGGVENERFADEERSFAELRDRIGRTIAFHELPEAHAAMARGEEVFGNVVALVGAADEAQG